MWQTDDEFDQGGTPAWRARHRQIIDVRRHDTKLARWWRQTPFWKLLVLALFFSFVVPWTFFWGSLIIGAILQASGVIQ